VEPKMVVFFDNCEVMDWSLIRPVSSSNQILVKDLCFARFDKVISLSDSDMRNLGVIQGLSKREKSPEFFQDHVAVTTIFDGGISVQSF